jgi:hypothetical protein
MCLPHRCVATRTARTTENIALLLLRVRFRGNVFTEPLASNKVFRPSGMSNYFDFYITNFNSNLTDGFLLF